MFKTRPCGCKGLRSCKICEEKYGAFKIYDGIPKENSYVLCYKCKMLWPGCNYDIIKSHPDHQGESIAGRRGLIKNIDQLPWDQSQSGRLKQNYGPKCNFKKRKVTPEAFKGYPNFTKFIQDRFKTLNLLKSFETVEQCSLEYTPERGSSIDPHIDDCWIWGERIPTLSLLTDSFLTLTKFTGLETKYNLSDTQTYPRIVTESGLVKDFSDICKEFKEIVPSELKHSEERVSYPLVIRIPMPRRSLLVLYGTARYDYEHSILREDIKDRRVCITYREITPTFLSCGPKACVGKEILEKSKLFWDSKEICS
ncbi:Alpha-ketoglutarate-dependent dioxygenase alkB-like protein 4 [Armadillidium nasatum]|uniref:Alpha-ketoglutarate-dependent dioxygenase alkB-like protein 4 n=1 Tax=Armadillidium nasatum TaxID=96803 RepID=A0A5N5SQQ2_9CRUS|nr:Alpha-ketoglutarate-dependent dioxygenase alkB-like protein 4 [Armadillidium nasatum]